MLLAITWNPNPNAFHIGTLSVKWYGIMWGISLLSTYFLGSYMLRTLKRDEHKLTILIQYIFILGLIGARLAQVIFYEPSYFLHHPLKIFAVWEGGLASHGGLIGGTLGLFLFCRRNPDYPLFWTIDHAAIVVLFLASFIRLGNLLNSELVGTPTTVPWAFIFTNVDNIPRHPVVLYESISYFMLQLLQLFFFKKYLDNRPGIYTTVFFVGVFTTRFLLEFCKDAEGSLFLGISKTQWLDVPFVILGLILLYLFANKKLKYNLPAYG